MNMRSICGHCLRGERERAVLLTTPHEDTNASSSFINLIIVGRSWRGNQTQGLKVTNLQPMLYSMMQMLMFFSSFQMCFELVPKHWILRLVQCFELIVGFSIRLYFVVRWPLFSSMTTDILGLFKSNHFKFTNKL